MKKYIFGERNGIYIINLEITQACLRTALDFLKKVITEGQNGVFTTGEPDDLKMKIEQMMKDLPRIEETTKQASIMEKFERSALIRAYADFLKKEAHHQ